MYIVAWGCCWYICFPRVSSQSKHVCVRESVLHLAVDLGAPGKKTWGANQITDPFGKEPSTCCGGVVSSGTSPDLTFSLVLTPGSILSWKGLVVSCDEAVCPVSDHTDAHPESQDGGTHVGEPAGFSQQMNWDGVRLRWDSSRLLLQVEVFCRCRL